MKKLLISGFEPFGGESINPSWEAVSMLPIEINGYQLTKLCLPVVFGEASEKLMDVAEKIRPDVILCIGQAGGREAITPELVAINLRYAKNPDNKGNMPMDEEIIDGGDRAYFSTVPVRRIADALASSGIRGSVSYSAGAYVCNDLLYTLLSKYNGSETRVGFIHVPYSASQGKQPSMELDEIVRGIVIAIENLD